MRPVHLSKKPRSTPLDSVEEGYTVVIVGEMEHPEVQGIVSYAGDAVVHVVADAAAGVWLCRA